MLKKLEALAKESGKVLSEVKERVEVRSKSFKNAVSAHAISVEITADHAIFAVDVPGATREDIFANFVKVRSGYIFSVEVQRPEGRELSEVFVQAPLDFSKVEASLDLGIFKTVVGLSDEQAPESVKVTLS